MKKNAFYLWLTVLAGLFASCSQDESLPQSDNNDHQVRIGASINQAVQTRAASVAIPAGYKLRYVLEVWNTKTEDAACIHKSETTATSATAVDFEFKLTEAGDYKALLWADFVETEASEASVTTPNTYTHYADKHYTTNAMGGLKAVALKQTGTSYVINDEARDAFFACIDIKKETGTFQKSVELTRPFGQINIIEKNTDLLTKVESMTLTYKVPQTFDVSTGTPGTTIAVNPTVSTLPTATTARKANLFYDFVFAPASSQTTMENIAMTFTSSDDAVLLNKFTIPANMPVVRNKRTNISGSILKTRTAPSDDAKLSVAVSDTWSETTEDKYIDPKVGDYYYKDGTWSTDNNATETNLVIGVVYKVNADGSGKVVSLTEPTNLMWGPTAVETGAESLTSGKENTDKILNGSYTLTDYPIFNACKELRRSTGNNGWYIPVFGEYADLFKATSNINNKITAISGVGVVAPTGESNGYWISREADSYGAILMLSASTAQSWTKGASRRVRFILDF